MNIVFENLSIESFMSIGKANISFNDKGYTLVEGVNNCPQDSASSNGSGKSSIWEALVWCLTGETIRGTTDVENIFYDVTTFVRCEFRVDEHSYTIERSQNKQKSSLKFYVDDKDISGKGIRDTKEVIKQYLPDFDALLLGSVIVLGQGLPARFTANTPSGRKEILEKLTKSDFMIEDLKERISTRSQKLKKSADELSSWSISQKATIKSNEELVEKLSKQIKTGSVEEYTEKIKENEKVLEDLQNRKADVEKDKKLEENKLSEIEQTIEVVNCEYKSEYNNVTSYHDESLDKLKQEYYDLESRAKSLKNQIVQYESVKEFCPTCGQKLPDVHKIDTSSMQQEYDSILSDIEKINSSISEENEKRSVALKSVDYKYADKLLELKLEKEQCKKTYQEYSLTFQNIIRDISLAENTIVALQSNIKFITDTNDSIKKQIEEAKEQTETVKEKLEYTLEEQGKVSQRQEIVSKFQTAITRDFRGYLLTNIISFINERCKELSKILFDNGSISVSLDKNNVSVKLNEKEYEMLSGGERQKVDVVVQFAIRDMLCSYIGFSSSIIVLDEIFDSIDLCGCDKIINLIGSELTDISSIFIITHRPDLQLPVDNTITVVKGNNGISYIK